MGGPDVLTVSPYYREFHSWLPPVRMLPPVFKKWGVTRIELVTSCTRSRNHTTRPNTRLYHRGVNIYTTSNRRVPGAIPLTIPGADKALNCTPNDESRLSSEEITQQVDHRKDDVSIEFDPRRGQSRN
jgi:hypothetical protein